MCLPYQTISTSEENTTKFQRITVAMQKGMKFLQEGHSRSYAGNSNEQFGQGVSKSSSSTFSAFL
jgi:hypothetical protein